MLYYQASLERSLPRATVTKAMTNQVSLPYLGLTPFTVFPGTGGTLFPGQPLISHTNEKEVIYDRIKILLALRYGNLRA